MIGSAVWPVHRRSGASDFEKIEPFCYRGMLQGNVFVQRDISLVYYSLYACPLAKLSHLKRMGLLETLCGAT